MHRTAKDLLRARWSRWTAIVEAFALRRPSRRSVDPSAYQALRRELIDACRSASDPTEGVTPAYAEGLEGLVLPWLSPKTLGQADPEILRGLLARCRQVERELGGRGAQLPASFGRGIESLSSAAARIARVLVLVLALIGLASILRATGFNPGTTLDRAAGWADLTWLAAKRSSDVERFGALALLVVPASIFLIRRVARS
jgi:hypothetical protein